MNRSVQRMVATTALICAAGCAPQSRAERRQISMEDALAVVAVANFTPGGGTVPNRSRLRSPTIMALATAGEPTSHMLPPGCVMRPIPSGKWRAVRMRVQRWRHASGGAYDVPTAEGIAAAVCRIPVPNGTPETTAIATRVGGPA